MAKEAITVIGLGKLGAPIAACFASRGYTVVAVDVDPETVRKVNAGEPPVFELGLKDLMDTGRERLRATCDLEKAVLETDVSFILVPTPTDSIGGFSLKHVLTACETIGQALRKMNRFHLVVLTSTVMPGSTGTIVMRKLEEASGKKCGTDFGLCYSPEFVALGSVIHDFFHPDFLLIGESDSKAGDILADLYGGVCQSQSPVARMNFVNAELTKLSVNTFVTTKIAFANMLARICERLPEADVDAVTSALGLDHRIGGKYLRGAIGYGGPCFPRDNLALGALGRQLGVLATLAESTDRANRNEVHNLVALVKSKLPVSGTVGILGLSYKPDTNVVEESQGLLLAQQLASQSINVIVYDPASMENAARVLPNEIRCARSAEECVTASNVIVIATPWNEFKNLKPETFVAAGTKRVLIDCWRVLPDLNIPSLEYIQLGRTLR